MTEIPICYSALLVHFRVPTPTGKIGRQFPFTEKSGNFEQTGKVLENHTKTGKVGEFQINVIYYFLVIFKSTVYYLLKYVKFSV